MGNNNQTPVERQIHIQQGKIAGVFGAVASAAAAGQYFFKPEWSRGDIMNVGSTAARAGVQIYQKYEQGQAVSGTDIRRAAFSLLLVVAAKTLVTPGAARLSQKDANLGKAATLAWSGAVALLGAYLSRSEDKLAQLESAGS